MLARYFANVLFGLAATLTGTLGVAAAAPPPERPRTLEHQLKESAPKILASLRSRKIERVGVLKFRVQNPDGRVTDNAGTINMFLADRLEAALALANPIPPDERIRLTRKASLTAATILGASHLSDAGRSLLFSKEYPPAWGTESVKVDAFVTGVAQFAPDNRSFDLGILAVRPGNPGLEMLLPPIKVATDAAILHESGQSFQVRSVPGRPELSDPAELARRVREAPQQNFPLNNNPSVVLRVFYDDEPVNLTFRDGEAWIPEPREGQNVKLELERMDRSEFALGVVLKVNGENTLYRQRLRDIDCSKWVLTGEKPKGVIRGFQNADNRQAEEFRVASIAESKNLEMNYGADVGTISLVVFREQSARPELAKAPRFDEAFDSLEDAPDLLVIKKAQFPDAPARNSEALKAQLRGIAGELWTRGLIANGRNIVQNVDLVDRDWHPEPIMSAVIRYYQPQDAP